ncbi:hypothetical protein V1477_014240 [Vespula maculifrons]|uniref:Uncharacterized protein n=1 Tax=Vespula maculifrons TaxID=7453 RepID=A0ABD2BKG7_VESMC
MYIRISRSYNILYSLFDFTLNCEVGILGCERGQQRRAFDRLLQLQVQLCFGLRRVNLEIFADATRADLNSKWGYSASRDVNKVVPLTDFYNH